MIKWLVLLLFIPLVMGVSCSEGDGCDPDCVTGDKDCSCEVLDGYECLEDQTCDGTLLDNWGGKMCCSNECSSGERLSEDTTVAVLTQESVQQEASGLVEKVKTKKGVTAAVVILLAVIIIGMMLKKVLVKFSAE